MVHIYIDYAGISWISKRDICTYVDTDRLGESVAILRRNRLSRNLQQSHAEYCSHRALRHQTLIIAHDASVSQMLAGCDFGGFDDPCLQGECTPGPVGYTCGKRTLPGTN